jgi:hypothetical protein
MTSMNRTGQAATATPAGSGSGMTRGRSAMEKKREKDAAKYCIKLNPCGHRVRRIDDALCLRPFVWWCSKCKRSLTDEEVSSVKPTRG